MTNALPKFLQTLVDNAPKKDSANPEKAHIVPSKLIANGPYIDKFLKGFICKNCGKCENIGSVIIDWDDIRVMAKFLGINEHDFARAYTIPVLNPYKGNAIALKQPCPFYDPVTFCKIHDKFKPKVCRLFPLHTVLCDDENIHLGVRSECIAGVEYMKRFEQMIWDTEIKVK